MFKKLPTEDAKQLIQEEAGLIIADVRDRDSYEEDHIKNAVHLSMAALQEFCDAADKAQPILVYCYHGISSQSVAQHLVDQGFTRVFSLLGGFEKWKEQHPSFTSSESEQ
jgi:thiosulfate sulfurtransferase